VNENTLIRRGGWIKSKEEKALSVNNKVPGYRDFFDDIDR